jgi:putative ABC transport system substrate-binding protein
MRRREFIASLGAATWPLVARAQTAVPMVGVVYPASADASFTAAYRKGLSETGYVEGQNVTVEYHWLDNPNQYDRLPALMDDFVRRRVAVIVTVANINATIAAKTATATIPIVFSVNDDPVKHGLVASLARPGGNATGVNFFSQEVVSKRLDLLHKLVPIAARIAVLLNPAGNALLVKTTLRDVQETARTLGLQTHVLNASTSREIDVAFEIVARERPDALFVAPNNFFSVRQAQIIGLAARERIPAAYGSRAQVAAGGLMSYGTRSPPNCRSRGRTNTFSSSI